MPLEDAPVICHVSYKVDLTQADAFGKYARAWVQLVERYGGKHLGFYSAAPPPVSAPFSFPGVGRAGGMDVAVAMFCFPDSATYERYRKDVAQDPECQIAEQVQRDAKCFLSYERTFMRRLA